jgi:hypothetical protein
MTKKAMSQFIMEKIEKTIKKGLEPPTPSPETTEGSPQAEVETGIETEPSIITTTEELEGYFYIKSILRGIIDSKRIVMRDHKSYCAILLDDNNRKSICRFYFDEKKKILGLIDAEKNVNKVSIEEVEEVYNYSNEIKSTVLQYEGNSNTEEAKGNERKAEIEKIEKDETLTSVIEGKERQE